MKASTQSIEMPLHIYDISRLMRMKVSLRFLFITIVTPVVFIETSQNKNSFSLSFPRNSFQPVEYISLPFPYVADTLITFSHSPLPLCIINSLT